ncbi:MAG: family Rossman fold protein, partial [Deltaproteobacteria bacterium]|nr:family Rossman fold protein [Deltaproteobacteria bacterium]
REIQRFYRVFHSARYVGKDLAIRVREPLEPAALRALAGDFRDLLAEGGMIQTEALPEEAEEPEIAGLPRIVFRFNNRSFGRLRQLIDRLNGEFER